jgi:hypothetical protein
MNYLLEYDRKLCNRLKKVDAVTARKNLLTDGYVSSSFQLPEYYQAEGLADMELAAIQWEATNPPRTAPIDIYTPKGRRSWRRFSLVHPYAYWQIVATLTEKSNWGKINELLTRQTGIAVYSTPQFDVKMKQKGVGIKAWLKLNEEDLLREKSDYKVLVATDIQNCYSSIYTHSLSWAIETKSHAQKNRYDKTLFGNQIDRLFQNSRRGQTNGIPTGTGVSDIMAEVLLKDVDYKLTEKLKTLGVDYAGARFRDDYRFLAKNVTDGEKILKVLNRILNESYDLTLNDSKTHIFEDILEGTTRPWNIALKNSAVIANLELISKKTIVGTYIKDYLIATYQIQRTYNEGRPAITLLHRLIKQLNTSTEIKINYEQFQLISSILRKLILLREEVTPEAMLILDKLLPFVAKAKTDVVLKELRDNYANETDADYQKVWLYRLCYRHNPRLINKLYGDEDSPLIKMLLDESLPHWEYYPLIDDFSDGDTAELAKFSFLNRETLNKSLDEPIDKDFLNAFTYIK